MKIKALKLLPLLITCLFFSSAFAQASEDFSDFAELDLEELLNTTVISASKREQKLSEAPNATLLAYNGNGDLKQKIVDEQIDVVFIAKGEKHQVKKLLELTQSEKILSCTSKAEYVATCGVTMAVGLKDNKPKIYLNLSSAKREGADFSAKFLRVAEIVDEGSK